MKLTGRRCQCRSCGEYFNSVPAFDRHRTGEYTLADGSSGRRCRTLAEMREIGMVLPAHGFWAKEAMREGRFWPTRHAKTAANAPSPLVG